MRKIAFTIAVLLSFVVSGQDQGEITYITKIDMHAGLPNDANGEMIRKMIPQYQEMKSTLIFTKTESLYQPGEGSGTFEEKREDEEGNDFDIKIRMDAPDEKIYTDVVNGLVVEQKDLMGKIFLIRDTINPAEWKITGDSKMVSGLNCQKATMQTEEGLVEAWFTAQIPVSAGPAGFGGLPGMIVYISMDDGKIQITAGSIVPRTVENGEIREPKKGKEISREKYAKLEEKKREQMKKQFGGGEGGNVIIVTEEK